MLLAFCYKSRARVFSLFTRLCLGESLHNWFILGGREGVLIQLYFCIMDRFVLFFVFTLQDKDSQALMIPTEWFTRGAATDTTLQGDSVVGGCSCQRCSWWSVWFTRLFTDMFQMLVIVSGYEFPEGSAASSDLGYLLRSRIAVGPPCWLPSVTSGVGLGFRGVGQMVRGLHGMREHRNTRVSWCFLCFSAHLVYILFKDYCFLLCLPGCRTQIGVLKTSARILESSLLRESSNSREPLQNH